MEIIGIIAEYNPLHNGHLYHIKKIKELYPDSLLILVVNGYFLERGEVSVLNKEHKTKLALEKNIDIVLELPFVFGTQSADIFASNALKILNELKVNRIIFGSECNDITKLNKIVDYITLEKDIYNQDVKKYLATGINYPTALAKALNIDFDFTPNDLLGISYLKAIKINNYKIIPEVIKRTNDYLDIISNEEIISATNIREKLKNNIDITPFVPNDALEYIESISLNNYFSLLKYKIITDNELDKYLDVDEGIHYRLKKVIISCSSTSELINQVKSKRYTYNKIQRMLVHILIGLTKEDNKKMELDYIKILGFNTKGQEYLNKMRKEITLPLSPIKSSLIYQYELNAALLYDMVSKYHNYKFEVNNKPLIKN